jgi:hypothetical protein
MVPDDTEHSTIEWTMMWRANKANMSASTLLLCCAGALRLRGMRIEASNAKWQECLEHRSARTNDDVDLA